MYDNCRGDNEAGVSLREEVASFAGLSLADTGCWACGEGLSEGDRVVVYVCRSAGSVRYEVGRVVCDADAESVRSEFTLGVRELVLEGRVGVCADVARQESWLMLVAPRVLGVSRVATRGLAKRPLGDADEAESSARTGPRDGCVVTESEVD
jgi:hypothetical protein